MVRPSKDLPYEPVHSPGVGRGMLFGSLVGFIIGILLGWRFGRLSFFAGLCSALGLVGGGFIGRSLPIIRSILGKARGWFVGLFRRGR